ncbi:MAG: phosphatidylinositol kinase- protein kinase tor1 [Chaenotheca gracillima]|nr:MAG: phosphatidylinositol kinase- protein kinase tor1 [Chaenotheca gracillima]
MPRSAADATRFTATGPHANSKPRTTPSSTIPGRGPPASSEMSRASRFPSGLPGETPQQKVARLKEAARRSKLDQISTFDKIVVRGRVWADRAHAVATLSLIGASVICGIYATVALTDMVMYNRRKRREFYTSQNDLYKYHLTEANEAVIKGVATESQKRLIEGERILQQEQQELKDKKLLNRGKKWLYGDLKRDAEEGEDLKPGTVSLKRATTVLTGRAGVESEVLKAVKELEAEKQARAEKESMLDAIGEEAAQGVSQSVASISGTAAAGGAGSKGSGGWGSWLWPSSKRGEGTDVNT